MNTVSPQAKEYNEAMAKWKPIAPDQSKG